MGKHLPNGTLASLLFWDNLKHFSATNTTSDVVCNDVDVVPMTSGRDPKRFKPVHLSEACEEKIAPSDLAYGEQQPSWNYLQIPINYVFFDLFS